VVAVCYELYVDEKKGGQHHLHVCVRACMCVCVFCVTICRWELENVGCKVIMSQSCMCS
jgi:hypothetical protein